MTHGYKDIDAIFSHLDTNSQGESHEMNTHSKERMYEGEGIEESQKSEK